MQYCLGRGGYGEVYRATMVSPGGLRAEVAVKLLRLDVSAHDDAVRRLRDEGRMLGLLQHPAILKVYDLAVLEGRVGLVTEYVDGADVLTVFGDLPQRALVEVVARVAEGLDAAWNHVPSDGEAPLRLVHRDIKPSNIRLGRHGEVKILDFGIARSTSDRADREAKTGTGSTVGSLAYMAPERFTRAPPSPASDVHALGCVLYEGLAGRRLFEDPVPVEMFRLAADPIAYEDHIEVAWKHLPDLTPGLSNLLAQMVAHAPGDRPTALEVRRLGEELAEQLPGPSLRTWARDFAWPRNVAPSPAGFLDGRTITEGSQSEPGPPPAVVPGVHDDDRSSDTFRIEVPGALTPVPAALRPAPASSQEVELVVPPARVGLTVVAVVVALLAVVVVGWVSWTSSRRAVGPAVEPVPMPVAAPAPVVPPPVVVPAPVPPPGPAPVEPPTPVVAPRPPPVPAPVVPAPAVPGPEVPPPAPVVPVSAPGKVTVVNGPDRIELRRGGEKFAVPGAVPAAPDYQLWVDFGTGLSRLPVYVPVVSDHVTVVRCNTLKFDCALE